MTDKLQEMLDQVQQLPEPSDAVPYMRAFRDIVWELVHQAKTEAQAEVLYRLATMHMLGTIKEMAKNFELDLTYLGIADFDPEKWFAGNAEKN